MNPNLFQYIWHHTRRDQIWVIGVILVSMPFLFLALDLPKMIVNGPIQGRDFTTPDATARFLEIKFGLPAWLGGSRLDLFDGFELSRLPYLVALSLVFLGLVCVNGLFKFYINTYKGRLGERMLRRLRYELVDRVLRFPLPHFRKVKSAELATMVKDEVEPLGGFIGDAFVQPVFLSAQALTAMVFIMAQSFWLGLIAAAIVIVQAFLIPKLRKRLLVLGKQQQLTARDLAGRVSEIVDGMAEVRTNDATNNERADIAHRLGRIFFIRYELFQRKFFVKFLNNFLAQLTPFLFYLIGGYFAIHGSLDIGQLVAVIAAYKDLPGPIKELIDWDQQRQDVQIKYAQVSEQFSPENMMAAALQTATPGPVQRILAPIEMKALSVVDDTGSKILENADLSISPGEWVAAVGEVNAGGEAAAEALARLVIPSAGRIRIGEALLDGMPESVTGRRMAYVGPDTYLRNGSIRESLLYGLRNYPLRPQPATKSATRAALVFEATASGNSQLDIEADWLDLARVEAGDAAEMTERMLRALELVEIDDDIFEFGLRSSPGEAATPEFAASILAARVALKQRLQSASLAHMVEPFDPAHYQSEGTVAANLVFGAAVDPTFSPDQLSSNSLVLGILAENGLDQRLFLMGRKIAATVVELFTGLPPDHPFFDRLSFVRAEELPTYRALLTAIGDREYAAVSAQDRSMMLGLALGYIEPRHRLNLLEDGIRHEVVAARQRLEDELRRRNSGAVAFYEPDDYNAASSLEHNILFGRIAHNVADAAARVRQAMRETLLDLGLRDAVLEAGLSFNVGPAGKRLTMAQRQRLGLARAILKRPDVLIVSRGLGALSPRNQASIIQTLVKSAKSADKAFDFAVFWVLASPALVKVFDRVVVFHEGKVVADGAPAELINSDSRLKRLIG